MPTNPTGYISTTQLAKHLGISPVAVFKRIKNGQIKAIKIGRSYAIHQSYIEDLPESSVPLLEKKYISVIEAAKLLNVSRIAIFKRIKSGQLEAKRVGRHYVIDENLILEEQQKKSDIKIDTKDEYLSIPQLAKLLGKNRITIFKQIQKGVIKAKKVGRHYVIARSDLLNKDESKPSIEQVQDKYISVAELAKELGVSRIAVFKRIQKGQIKAVKMGRSYAIPVNQIKKEWFKK